ncbi:unnamed protein product [Xylocopa violacea]|uniref:Uncharacterized protein n=1 Tax=Xylocopa violacea TaxID=135666 RepID=A0ABP1NA76_XYLVO
MMRFSECLNVDVREISRAIVNVLSSTHDALLDFDLRKLTHLAKRSERGIEDVVTRLFWQSRGLPKNRLENGNWFDSVDQGYVVPIYLPSEDEPIDLTDEYLNCVHVIEKSTRNVVRWYFLDVNSGLEKDSYLIFEKKLKEKAKERKRNVVISKGEYDGALKHHAIHIFRYSSVNHCDSDQTCPFDNESTLSVLRNPFMPVEGPNPFIVQSYDPENSKYVFHMVCKDASKESSQNFCNLLILLQEVLLRMRIDCVAVHSCSSLNLREVLKMIKYVFYEQKITVIAA